MRTGEVLLTLVIESWRKLARTKTKTAFILSRKARFVWYTTVAWRLHGVWRGLDWLSGHSTSTKEIVSGGHYDIYFVIICCLISRKLKGHISDRHHCNATERSLRFCPSLQLPSFIQQAYRVLSAHRQPLVTQDNSSRSFCDIAVVC